MSTRSRTQTDPEISRLEAYDLAGPRLLAIYMMSRRVHGSRRRARRQSALWAARAMIVLGRIEQANG